MNFDDPQTWGIYISAAVLAGVALSVVAALLWSKFLRAGLEDSVGDGMEDLRISGAEPVQKFQTVCLYRLVATRKHGFTAAFESVLIACDDINEVLGSPAQGRVVGDELVELVFVEDAKRKLVELAPDLDAGVDRQALHGEFRGRQFMASVDHEFVMIDLAMHRELESMCWIQIDRLSESELDETHDQNRQHGEVYVRFNHDSAEAYETYILPVVDVIADAVQLENLLVHIDECDVTVTCEAIVSEPVLRFLLAVSSTIAEAVEGDGDVLPEAVW